MWSRCGLTRAPVSSLILSVPSNGMLAASADKGGVRVLPDWA
ncbi:hypothetical protein [Schaalia dentiphila]|nr:hypothetical protein [Schaalia sp. C24]